LTTGGERDIRLPHGVPVGLYRTTIDGRILAVNDVLVELLGYSDPQSLMRVNARDLYVAPEDRTRLASLAAQDGAVKGYETELRRRDGRHVFVELNLSVRHDAEGAYYEGAVSDITERKLAEETLWESERRLRLVVNQMPAVLWSTDAELRFTLSLGAGLAALGLRPNEVVGRPLAEFFGAGEAGKAILATHARCLRGESLPFEAVWLEKRFQCYVEPLRDAHGALVGTLGVALDVTEARQAQEVVREAEARYRHLVESVKAVVWRGDPRSFRFSFVSREAEGLLGYPIERWTSDPTFWVDHIHPEDRARVIDTCRSATAELRPHEFEYRMIAADGRIVWLRDIVRVIAADGEAQESVGLMIDVTEQKRDQAVRAALYRVGEKAGAAAEISELYAEIHAAISGLMPARNFYIALHDPERDVLEFPHFVDEVDPPPRPKRPGRGLTEYVLRSGEPFLATPQAFADLVARGEVELIGAPSLDWLGVPLKTDGRTMGVVVVQSYSASVRYGERERDILALFSQQIASAIERQRAAEKLRHTVSLLRATLEATGDGILVVDLSGRVVSFNQRFVQLWRIPTEVAAPLDDRRLLSYVAAQVKYPQAFLERVQALYADVECEARDLVEFKDGRVFARYSGPQRLDGRAVGRVWSFQDVTPLRQASP
jgi:PAS domain S-box-containing protein